LGYPRPIFAHIPLIVGADRARLSKRQGATSVEEYRQVGYLAEAFVNYLALLGWSPGNNREMVPPNELIELFDLSKVKKAAAFFDLKKLDWLNGQYLKQTPVPKLAELLAERLIAKGWIAQDYNRPWMEQIAALVHDRIRVLEDIEEQDSFFFHEPPEYQPEAVAQHLKQPEMSQRLMALRDRLSKLPAFDIAALEATTRAFAAENQIESKVLIHPVRVAVTGRAVSPPLFGVMAILGREKVLNRLSLAAELARI